VSPRVVESREHAIPATGGIEAREVAGGGPRRETAGCRSTTSADPAAPCRTRPVSVITLGHATARARARGCSWLAHIGVQTSKSQSNACPGPTLSQCTKWREAGLPRHPWGEQGGTRKVDVPGAVVGHAGARPGGRGSRF
jgi:hypothetical protein